MVRNAGGYTILQQNPAKKNINLEDVFIFVGVYDINDVSCRFSGSLGASTQPSETGTQYPFLDY